MGSSKFLLLLFLLHLIAAALPAAAQLDLWAHQCIDSYGNYTSNSPFKSNLDNLLTNISTTDVSYGFYNFSSGQEPDQAYVIALCRGDVDVADCHTCINFVKSNLTSLCPNQQEFIGWADNCMLRYSSRNILGGGWEVYPAFSLRSGTNVTDLDQFIDVLQSLLQSLPNRTASGDSRLKFATGEANVTASQKVYALLQCTPDLSSSDCLGCLYRAIYRLLNWDGVRGQTGARLLFPSCSARYEIQKFYSSPDPSPPPPPLVAAPPPPSPVGSRNVHRGKRLPLFLEIVGIPTFGGILLTLGMWFYLRNRRSLTDFEGYNTEEITAAKSLQMDFNKVRSATQNFARDRKLGEGGFGDVFKVRT